MTVKRDLDSYMEQLVSPKAERLRHLYTARYERMLSLLDPQVSHGDVEAINTARPDC